MLFRFICNILKSLVQNLFPQKLLSIQNKILHKKNKGKMNIMSVLYD